MSRGACAFTSRAGRSIGAGIALLAGVPGVAHGAVAWTVNFPDPASLGSAATALHTTILAAGAEWSRYLDGDARLDITVSVDTSVARAEGRSLTSCFLYDNGLLDVWDQGAAAEVRRGIDPNGATADIEIRLSPAYLAGSLWFDPNPFSRTAPVPAGKTDALSVMLHEIGHALGFNGWRDGDTGAIGSYGSPFDAITVFDGSDFFFVGSAAVAEYGAPVPLTFGNIFHVGNLAPRPGATLRDDLMNGVTFKRGVRYGISRLDLAMLHDMGLPVVYPDVPAPGAIGALGLWGLVALRRRR